MIFDASTLILCAKIEILRKISKSYNIAVSEEVKEECTADGEFLDAKLIEELINQNKIKILKIKNKEMLSKIKNDFNLGVGEASSLLLAKKTKNNTCD